MKLKILSIEPNWNDLPAMSVATKAFVSFKMRNIVKWQVTEHKDTGYESTTPIEGETYTTEVEGSLILRDVKKDAVEKIRKTAEYYKGLTLPRQEFYLMPVEDLKGKEFELGDNR